MNMGFLLEQQDADEFVLRVAAEDGCLWLIPMSTSDAVALFEAVDETIGEHARTMRQARRAARSFRPLPASDPRAQAFADEAERGFEGVGDFSSDDPVERWRAHEASKGRAS